MKNDRQIYNAKVGIGRSDGFNKKLLAQYAVNLGNMCEFHCTFCYVPSITIKQKTIQTALKSGKSIGSFSSYRNRENVIESVKRDLGNINPANKGTVFFCTTCDPCAIPEHRDTTIAALRLIMEQSKLQARILSKSTLIFGIAEALNEYKQRIFYSLSTGTSLPEISQAIEENASPILERVNTLHKLQDSGYRTYGMICPVIPSELANVKKLVDQVRPELCEHVWVEAVNVRGKSLVQTRVKLSDAGLNEHAKEIEKVMGDKAQWLEYSKNLFLAFQLEMRARGLIKKLRFLQYVTKDDKVFFENQEGAVCL